MTNKDKSTITAVSLPHPGELLVVESLDYSNPYDFHSIHRHDYFEVILVKEGAGTQLIDFIQYQMTARQVFAVYPGQMHLMNRNNAQGLLIQFRKNIFEHIHPLKHFHLYFADPVFNFDPEIFSHLYNLTEHISALLRQEKLTQLSGQKAYNYLQIILISMAEINHERINLLQQGVVAEFLSLLTDHIYTKKNVADYCELMNCSPDKLTNACKTTLGKTPLHLIHEEMLLEVKRLLLVGQLSLKEIAYELNFDGQANFSGFIKARTGLSPSELQLQVREIYK